MKILSCSISNFLTISHAVVKLADRGLNLIQGVNDEDESAASNGAGKSSIADAISWALYGVTARGVKGDAVVNRKAKKETVVIAAIEVGAITYKVERYRKHSTGKNSLRLYALATDPADPSVDLTRGTDAETQKELEKILGATHEVFVAAVYSGQEAMPDLPRMGDRDLKRLIEEAAGMQRIERAYGVARERLNTAKSKLSEIITRIDTTKVSLTRTEEGLTDRRQKAADWDASRVATLADLQKRVDAAKATATAAASAAVSRKAAHDQANARLAEIAIDMGKHADALKAARDADAAASKAEQAIEKHALQSGMDKINRIKAQIDNAPTELNKPCSECGTPGKTAPDALEKFVAHKKAHLAQAKEEFAATKTRVTAQLSARNAAQLAAEEARAAVPDVTALDAERAAAQIDVRAFTAAVESVRVAKNTYDQEVLTFNNQSAAPNPHRSVVEDLERRLAEEVSKVAAFMAEREQAEKALEIADSVVKVFGPAGVRAQILDTVTPYLNARTADYLSVLGDGHLSAIWTTLMRSATGDLKEKFGIEVTHAKGGESFAALSGGEKRKVRLATALALQDLVASRATQPIDLWIGDEVDDALDTAGLERLMTILERKARERGTVLVISHSDLRDWIDNVTTVTKAGEWTSTVEGSLCA